MVKSNCAISLNMKGDKMEKALTTVTKSIYEQPKIDVCAIITQDVITTSTPKNDWSAEWDPI